MKYMTPRKSETLSLPISAETLFSALSGVVGKLKLSRLDSPSHELEGSVSKKGFYLSFPSYGENALRAFSTGTIQEKEEKLRVETSLGGLGHIVLISYLALLSALVVLTIISIFTSIPSIELFVCTLLVLSLRFLLWKHTKKKIAELHEHVVKVIEEISNQSSHITPASAPR
ncbi:hypothetical protein [Pelagicoccus albus]|uniref:Uncharacterized protein n=1 Tax=Pelagicoccus albus TaxID=415222 RepID=A0A7X1EA08_9BACT|nr:hypothetical protein [Pelagicoccus albus]MBC2606322.1 hypothetical protein [Pelagicoccus albus]